MGLTVNSLQVTFMPTSKSRDTRTKIISKIWPDQIWILCPGLKICGWLQAPIVNGGGDAFENGQSSNFEGLVALTLDWVTAYQHASVIDLYLHSTFH